MYIEDTFNFPTFSPYDVSLLYRRTAVILGQLTYIDLVIFVGSDKTDWKFNIKGI